MLRSRSAQSHAPRHRAAGVSPHENCYYLSSRWRIPGYGTSARCLRTLEATSCAGTSWHGRWQPCFSLHLAYSPPFASCPVYRPAGLAETVLAADNIDQGTIQMFVFLEPPGASLTPSVDANYRPRVRPALITVSVPHNVRNANAASQRDALWHTESQSASADRSSL